MQFVTRPMGTPIPKVRALGSTLTAESGIAVDDIVVHGNRSSKELFEQFYRISVTTSTDFTKVLTLSAQQRSQGSKFKLKINKYDKVRENITAHALLHAQEVENISEEFNINSGDTSKTFEAESQLAEKVSRNTTNSEDISQVVSSSSVPNMLKMLGPYEEIDAEVISLLNADSCITQKQLHLAPKLFTDALIHNKLTLMAITSEVYSKHATIDIHLETSDDSLLFALMERTYQRKLLIGLHTMNILITCSTTIVASRLQEVFVGHQFNVSPTDFTVNSTRVFLRSEEVSSFKKAFSSCLQLSSDCLPPSISCLRQLTSSFNHTSTYAYFRATLDDFNDTRFMPVTVFTLCDTPDQDGYGSNHNSAPRIGSLLLQTTAINLSLKRDLSKETISLFQTAYESAQRNEDNESWKIIDQVMNQMNILIEQNDDKPMKISKFILGTNFSKVANLVGSHLYKANQKVASNIKVRLLDLYG
ncbi:uncharacterized protein B0P05DRAFT_590821 [Gilbertella persicaria]|nr:uncharacterized protein B0P05DRAFT_590821 [Gilbertella persicaria]KAI8060404.1 hypothetical protein B0P05DRAFT_590821 [Gilbertella persicaria]